MIPSEYFALHSFIHTTLYVSVQFSSVAQSCSTLCDPMNRSMPDLPVHHQLLEFTQAVESVMPSNHLILCFPLFLLPSIFPSIRVFQMSQFFVSDGQSIGTSTSASVLPMNIQDWFPLGWTCLFFQSKGLNTRVQSISSSVLSFLYGPTFISIHDYWKNHSLD